MSVIKAGDKVQVLTTVSKFGAQEGDTGTVVSVREVLRGFDVAVRMETGPKAGITCTLPARRLAVIEQPRFNVGDRVYIAREYSADGFYWSPAQARYVGKYGTVTSIGDRGQGRAERFSYNVEADGDDAAWRYLKASLVPESEAKLNLVINGEDYYARQARAHGLTREQVRTAAFAAAYGASPQTIERILSESSYVLITQDDKGNTTRYKDEDAALTWLKDNGENDKEYTLHRVTELRTVRVKRSTVFETVTK